jgi:glycosyltransferase involved in cell wall biosynthesis
LIRILKKNNKKLFVIGAGCIDSFTCDFFEHSYKYKSFYKAIINHYKIDKLWGQTRLGRDFNKWLFEKIDGYIPVMYEYAEGHRNVAHGKLKKTIPIPLKIDDFEYNTNNVKDKVIVFHGISRREVKGTDFIIEQLNNLKDTFPDKVELLIVDKVPYSEYIKLVEKANIVVDQLYSVSTGVNGLISMSLGKVLLGGGDKEFLKEFCLEDSPLISIGKDKMSMYNTLKELVHNHDHIECLGLKSRMFVEDIHDANKIALKYINVWNEN